MIISTCLAETKRRVHGVHVCQQRPSTDSDVCARVRACVYVCVCVGGGVAPCAAPAMHAWRSRRPPSAAARRAPCWPPPARASAGRRRGHGSVVTRVVRAVVPAAGVQYPCHHRHVRPARDPQLCKLLRRQHRARAQHKRGGRAHQVALLHALQPAQQRGLQAGVARRHERAAGELAALAREAGGGGLPPRVELHQHHGLFSVEGHRRHRLVPRALWRLAHLPCLHVEGHQLRHPGVGQQRGAKPDCHLVQVLRDRGYRARPRLELVEQQRHVHHAGAPPRHKLGLALARAPLLHDLCHELRGRHAQRARQPVVPRQRRRRRRRQAGHQRAALGVA
ncbi:MAG: hypothetical protein J3K34DRAFT_425294 [Monoraphidium minutum]|nr:MAG: hypothetical protein J3K34DRAFT_425294 [Monoraphidium minutum]